MLDGVDPEKMGFKTNICSFLPKFNNKKKNRGKFQPQNLPGPITGKVYLV